MLQEIKSFWALLMRKTEAKVNEGKQPLSRESAYVLASIGKKKGHYTDVTKEYQEYVLNQIKSAASMGHNYVLVEHPSYITPTDKEGLVDFIGELGYSICFVNGDVILISWKYSPNDFQMRGIDDRKAK